MFYMGMIILLIICVILLSRLFSVKKEIRKIRQQLHDYNNRETNQKIEMLFVDRDLEDLGVEINRLIDLFVAANRDKIRFESEQKQAIANISHDLRTPLTSILGFLQMAQSTHVSEEEKAEYLMIAKQRAKRLETLLNDFFELSLIESPDYQLESKRINLKQVTIDTLISFYDLFNQHHIEPTIDLPDHDIFIMADLSAVTRIIENLLSNAVIHSDGNLTISLRESNSTVHLMISNDAHHLTEQDVTHLLDRFYMADQSRSGKSTGLGLSIVKSLLEKMGGHIKISLNHGNLSITCEWTSVT